MSKFRIFVVSAYVVMACLPLSVLGQSASVRCLVIGDSIAVGVSNHSRCLSISTGGLSSWRWLDRWGRTLDAVDPEVVLISLGANDADDRRSFPSLAKVRAKLRALMASPNSPTRGHPKFPQAAQLDYDVSGRMAKRAAASLSL